MGKHEDLIVEMLDRIIKLEKEVEKLKSQQIINGSSFGPVEPPDVPDSNRRDNKPLFKFNNKDCTRAELVLEVIRKYVSEHGCNYVELSAIFPKELQGAMNVIAIPDMRPSFNKEYYDMNNPIRILDGDCFVCNKWGIINIERFIDKVYELGYRVDRIYVR